MGSEDAISPGKGHHSTLQGKEEGSRKVRREGMNVVSLVI